MSPLPGNFCQNCKQTALADDLRKDRDGKLVCENCFTGASKTGDRLETKLSGFVPQLATPAEMKTRGSSNSFVTTEHNIKTIGIGNSEFSRDRLLSEIVMRAHGPFIDALIAHETTRLRAQYGWIELVERVQDIHILLRMASELGWTQQGGKKKHVSGQSK